MNVCGQRDHAAAGLTIQPVQLSKPRGLLPLSEVPCCVLCCASQVVSACLGLLHGSHDRSRLPAAQLLLVLASQPGLVPRLEPCLATLLTLLADAGEGDGGANHHDVMGKCFLHKANIVI